LTPQCVLVSVLEAGISIDFQHSGFPVGQAVAHHREPMPEFQGPGFFLHKG